MLLLSVVVLVHAQNGNIRGKVFDQSTGESLVGVTVFVVGTSTGTITDLDGAFTLSLPDGNYSVQLSYISYQTLVIENIAVNGNETTRLSDIGLKESTVEIDEIVISAQAVRTTETALQAIKLKAPAMLDGISSARIQLIGDGTAVEAAKRVTGVSIEGGKYVYVRGLGDRYSKTTLNSLDIPGLDPDRNSLQLDIFPTNLIDNLIVSKNFTADMPADFTGGIMNIETKDFPDDKILSLSVSTSYNPQMHFNPDFLTYTGGKTDLLGFDDGSRALPEKALGPLFPMPNNGLPDQQIVDFIRSFNPQLGAASQTSLMDVSAGFSLGNQISFDNREGSSGKNRRLGYIFSLSYKSEYKYYDDVINSEYQRFSDPTLNELRYAFIQDGVIGERNILIGALGGLAYKTNFSKVRLMAMHLQNGESRAGQFDLDDDGGAVGKSGYVGFSDNLEYNQRSLSNILLNGTHLFKDAGWEIDWRVSPTFSTSNDPDIRETAFTHRPIDTLFQAGAAGNPSRIWRELSEVNIASRLDFTKSHQLFGRDAKLKFGLSYGYKARDYEILFIKMQFTGTQRWTNYDPNFVLDPINLYPNRPNSVYYIPDPIEPPNSNQYSSNVHNSGSYISAEVNPLEQMKLILGLRAENYVQRHTGRDQTYARGDEVNGKNLDNEIVLESLSLFPTVNLIYSVAERQNIRTSYSKTVARPSFKELSFAQILDPISDRIFNGSLFPYSDWDGNLTETKIDNFDLRWELFLTRGQMFSVSGFYKRFIDPIELVRIPEQQTNTEYQARNVGEGSLYGVELEVRKDLDFISDALRNFNVSGNVTFVESFIAMTEGEYSSRKSYERVGETIQDTRDMAGQAPYVINAGITYGSHDESGWDAGLFYNVKGPTLSIVGIGLYPDIYVVPFHSLNFSILKQLGNGNTVIDFKAANLLNNRVESVFVSYEAEPQPYSIFNPGRSFSIGLKHSF
ncbi:MAG: TonB-dependent receptor [Bacteroidales bacterium]